ncbi:PqqD family peptide modification chaperone [Halomonas vilamensis]|uniref:PqqD family peptide modification chaperone n=1 Tax=Vreelandella vilamensis TaxID=531309 RepID=A0ABU1H8D3_9GAMM|nr:PqqD family peptide modification chaperone [Halomonas vilamensis]MDR5899922.1 PqqD family peptide modification chaperone [Halomonas vilamensis]
MSAPTPTSPRFWLSGQRHAEQDHFFRQALENQGWQEGDDQHWQAAWVTGMPPKAAFRHTSPERRMNHIPGNAALTVKSRLHESLSALRERTIRHYGAEHPHTQRLYFFPRAYEMPHDYPALVEDAAAHPEKRWILKPTNASKGQGVRVLRDPATAPLAPNWLVQEYVGNPHTIRGHKYVLRLYMLIASIDPLRVYLYRQGFAKLASAPWDPNDIDNVYSQLTNPDINARNQEAEIPVEFIDLERYRAWLREQGHDDDALFAKLEDLATLTALSSVEAMRARSHEAGADPRGCYELIGLDCLVDDDLKPWILECNLSPSLGVCAAPEHGGVVEERVKESLVRDTIALIGLDSPAPETFTTTALADERDRAGDFVPLYPSHDGRYMPFVGLPSLADYRLATLPKQSSPTISFRPHHVSELIDGETLALYHHDSGLYYQLNDTAALIWLLASEGESTKTILAHLQDASGDKVPRAQLEEDLWATLHPWWQNGLLAPSDAPIPSPPDPFTPERAAPATWRGTLHFDHRVWPLTAPAGPVADKLTVSLARLLRPAEANHEGTEDALHVLESASGYCLTNDARVIRSRLHADEILPAIAQFCLTQATRCDHLVLDVALLSEGAQHIVCLLPAQETANVLATLKTAANAHGLTLSRGARLSLETPNVLEPLNFPITETPLAETPFSDATLAAAERGHCAGLLWLDTEPTTATTEPPTALEVLGALLPFAIEDVAIEGKHRLSPAALTALQWFSQGVIRTRLVYTEEDATRDVIAHWLTQTPLFSSSRAAV